jgi:hypothetical protein
MTAAIKIEEDVPLPGPAGGLKRYPFDEMKVGQSFFMKDDDLPAKTGAKGLRSAATMAQKKLGMKFTIRRVNKGYRLWRTE